MNQTTTTDRLYRVLVDYRAAQERYTDYVRGIHAAKDRAEELVWGRYAGMLVTDSLAAADEVAGVVEALIRRLKAQRGEVGIYDDYLDLEVSVADLSSFRLYGPDADADLVDDAMLFGADRNVDLGPATLEQVIASDESDAKGQHGHIQIDADGNVIPEGGFVLGPTRRVYTS